MLLCHENYKQNAAENRESSKKVTKFPSLREKYPIREFFLISKLSDPQLHWLRGNTDNHLENSQFIQIVLASKVSYLVLKQENENQVKSSYLNTCTRSVSFSNTSYCLYHIKRNYHTTHLGQHILPLPPQKNHTKKTKEDFILKETLLTKK